MIKWWDKVRALVGRNTSRTSDKAHDADIHDYTKANEYPVSDEMKKYLALCHEDLGTTEMGSTVESQGIMVPLIRLEPGFYDFIQQTKNQISKGHGVLIDCNLNVRYNDLGDVFVEVLLQSEAVSEPSTIQVLIHANRHLDFFELLAETGVLSVVSPENKGEFLLIQLPHKEKAVIALDIIKETLLRRR